MNKNPLSPLNNKNFKIASKNTQIPQNNSRGSLYQDIVSDPNQLKRNYPTPNYNNYNPLSPNISKNPLSPSSNKMKMFSQTLQNRKINTNLDLGCDEVLEDFSKDRLSPIVKTIAKKMQGKPERVYDMNRYINKNDLQNQLDLMCNQTLEDFEQEKKNLQLQQNNRLKLRQNKNAQNLENNFTYINQQENQPKSPYAQNLQIFQKGQNKQKKLSVLKTQSSSISPKDNSKSRLYERKDKSVSQTHIQQNKNYYQKHIAIAIANNQQDCEGLEQVSDNQNQANLSKMKYILSKTSKVLHNYMAESKQMKTMMQIQIARQQQMKRKMRFLQKQNAELRKCLDIK